MPNALVMDSVQYCPAGSMEFVPRPDQPTVFTSGGPACSIFGVFENPFHGECKLWLAATEGMQPNCISLTVPVLFPGSFTVRYFDGPAGTMFDEYLCTAIEDQPISEITGDPVVFAF